MISELSLNQNRPESVSHQVRRRRRRKEELNSNNVLFVMAT
jgi:hypothetical protein